MRKRSWIVVLDNGLRGLRAWNRGLGGSGWVARLGVGVRGVMIQVAARSLLLHGRSCFWHTAAGGRAHGRGGTSTDREVWVTVWTKVWAKVWATVWKRVWVACALSLLPVMCAGQAMAHDDTLPTRQDDAMLTRQDDVPLTLHVYENLIQIPVLVLSPARKPMAPIAASRFLISLDSGPPSRPTHVRREGDDPIALSILLDTGGLDAGGARTDLLNGVDEAVARLVPTSLLPADTVQIYSLDCNLVRTSSMAAMSGDELKRKVEAALAPWKISGRTAGGAPCRPTVGLRDAMVYMTKQLSEMPGRRVLLAVSHGRDQGSKNSWDELRRFAAGSGVAIFGMRGRKDTVHAEAPGDATEELLRSIDPMAAQRRSGRDSAGGLDYFRSLCESTGGLVLESDQESAVKDLAGFAAMLRGRYIVEFPRSDSMRGTAHLLNVAIANSNAFIRTSGITVPLADPRVLADPTTVPKDESRVPAGGPGEEEGKPYVSLLLSYFV